ncbi:MAG: TonB-dependent receptor [Bacteroidetes bacterium]|nr:TonB-dependent receptor [Bacteroidota bacterium]
MDEDNIPLPGANIYIPELYSGIATDIDGNYVITNLQAGKYKVQFSFIGYETWIQNIVVEDKDLVLDVKLHPSVFQSQDVVISGGRPSSQHENAIKIETIAISSIQTSGSPSLIQSLSQVPGVDMIGKGNAVATPVIRGLSTSNILVLNNGIRMENYQFSENHPYLIDEFGIDQVEIIKGPASLLYGSDAIGGVLNFIKEKPANAGTVSGDATLQYHSNTNGYTGNLGVKGTSQKVYWGLRGGVKTHMDYLDGSGDFAPNTRFNQGSIKTFAGINSSVGNFRVYYDYIKMNPGMCVEPVIDVITERGRKNEIWYQDLDMHLVSSRNTFFLNAFKLEANIAYQYNNRRLNGSDQNPPLTLVDARLNTFNYEIKANYASGERSNFILAVQGMSQLNKNQEAPAHILPDFSMNDISVSGLVQHDFERGIHLQFGLRFDNRFIDIPEQVIHGHDHGDEGHEEEKIFEQLNRYYGNLSGSLGLTFNLNEQFLIRGNIASAYRTPNIAELSQDGRHGTRYEQGDRNLNSQRNYEGDLSMHYHSKHVLLDVAGFYNYIDQYIFLAPTSDTTFDGDYIYRYSQNDAFLYGMEIVMEILATHNFGIKGTYNYIRGKQSNKINLPFIPHNRLNLEIKWSKKELWVFKNSYLKAGSGIAFNQDDPAPFETSTSGYTLFNAGIGFVFNIGNQPFNIDVIGTNLGNRNYIDHLSTLKTLGYHNPGRNIMVNLAIPFTVAKGM